MQNLAAGERTSWLAVIYRFIVGEASTPLYYIVVLIQLTLLTPILIKTITKKGIASRLLWFVTPVYLVYIYSFNIITGSTPRLYGTFFPAWVLFFYFCLWVKISGCDATKKFGRSCYIAIGLMLSLIEAAILRVIGCSSSFATSQIKISSFLFAGFLILWLIKKETTFPKDKVNRFIKHIGDRSFGIFFIHCFVLKFVKKFCNILFQDIWLLNFIICFIITAALSILVVDVVRIIAKKLKIEKTLRWIGF